jgi:hypothetical protein
LTPFAHNVRFVSDLQLFGLPLYRRGTKPRGGLSMPFFAAIRTPVFLIAVSAALALVGGCTGSMIFHDDFERDSVGAAPAPSPPGDPSGDRVAVGSSLAGPDAIVINGPPGPDGTHALALRRRPFMFPIYLQAATAPESNGSYLIAWRGSSIHDRDDSGLLISVTSGHFVPAMGLLLQHGNFYLIDSSTSSLPPPIGQYHANRAHTVLIRVDRPSRTFNISINEPNQQTINVQQHPVADVRFFQNQPVEILMGFTDMTTPTPPGTEPDTYRLETATINTAVP